jgi:hypothetical protein
MQGVEVREGDAILLAKSSSKLTQLAILPATGRGKVCLDLTKMVY